MHVSRIANNNKSVKTKYTSLIRESYRENAKVKTRVICNISHLPEEEILAIDFALKHKCDVSKYIRIKELSQVFKSVGEVETNGTRYILRRTPSTNKRNT
jgi:hypothetical protein